MTHNHKDIVNNLNLLVFKPLKFNTKQIIQYSETKINLNNLYFSL